MNALVLLAEVESGGQIEQIARTFGVDWPHLAAQMISFSIVCLLLYRFAYKRVLKTLEDRRQLIAQGLTDSMRMKAELAWTEARRHEVVAEAYDQAHQYLEEARSVAARLKEEEAKKATADAERIIVNAHAAAVQDRARMFAELKRDVGRLVVQTTTVVTGKILTPEDQRRLAEETARQLNK